MIKILETITEQDYKSEIISTINETQKFLDNIKNALEQSKNQKKLDTLLVSTHELYDNVIDIFYKLSQCD